MQHLCVFYFPRIYLFFSFWNQLKLSQIVVHWLEHYSCFHASIALSYYVRNLYVEFVKQKVYTNMRKFPWQPCFINSSYLNPSPICIWFFSNTNFREYASIYLTLLNSNKCYFLCYSGERYILQFSRTLDEKVYINYCFLDKLYGTSCWYKLKALVYASKLAHLWAFIFIFRMEVEKKTLLPSFSIF